MRGIIALITVVLLCLAIFTESKIENRLKRMIDANAAIWPKMFLETDDKIIRLGDDMSPELLHLFKSEDIISVDGRLFPEIIWFNFRWSYYEGEKSRMLMYSGEKIELDFFVSMSQEWTYIAESSHQWKWTGGGINGKGYIVVEELRPNWFFVDMYFPT